MDELRGAQAPVAVRVLAALDMQGAALTETRRGEDADVAVVETGGERLAVKHFRHQSKEVVLREARLLAALGERGFACPAPLMMDGEPMVVIVDERPAAAYRFLAGEPMSPSEAPAVVASSMAQLHRLTVDWCLPPRPDSDPVLIAEAADLVCRRWSIECIRGIPAQRLWEEAAVAVARLQHAGLPRSVVHHDPHPGNVLRSGGRAVLIDYGEASSEPSVVDLASLLVKWRGDPRSITDEELGAVRTAYEDVRELSTWERALLPDAVLSVVASGSSEYLLRHQADDTAGLATSESAVLLAELVSHREWAEALNRVFG